MRHLCNRLILCTAALLVLLMWSCAPADRSKPTLTVSIPPQKYLLEQIVGDRYVVNSLLSAGTNPETYDPTIGHLAGMEHSTAYFRLGTLSFEQAMLEKIESNFPQVKIFDSAKGIDFIYEHHHADDDADHHREAPDPHVWTSVENLLIIASNMYEQVVELDPDHHKYYQQRYSALRESLQQANDSIATLAASARNKTFLIWHPSLSYFARQYGVKQIAMEQHSKETTPADFQQRLKEIEAQHPGIFFVEREQNPAKAQSVASQFGIPVEYVSLMEEDMVQQLLLIARNLNTH